LKQDSPKKGRGGEDDKDKDQGNEGIMIYLEKFKSMIYEPGLSEDLLVILS
jgi:hypothetical protein